ncbi:serine/threonine protein kinase [Nocardioidaceae bacterium]|nr:serine/threonine protein kinase [Nocardioidaceae bacterium]
MEKDAWGLAEGDAITPELTTVRRLGGGAAYEAVLAFDEITLGPVVVKLVRPDQVQDASTLRGLAREVEALELVRHPAVVRALRHDLDSERPHLVLEALDGPRLSSLIRRYGPLQPEQYLPLGVELAAAAHYLRHLGWVHLDIKPSNIIMGAPAKLIDLSVARPEFEARALTYAVGTDAYMAPEQCVPQQLGEPSYASDVWGICATLAVAITGTRVFAGQRATEEGRAATLPQVTGSAVDDLAPRLPSGFPRELADVLLAGLAHDPADRPMPHEIADAIGPVLAGLPRGRLAGAFKVR